MFTHGELGKFVFPSILFPDNRCDQIETGEFSTSVKLGFFGWSCVCYLFGIKGQHTPENLIPTSEQLCFVKRLIPNFEKVA